MTMNETQRTKYIKKMKNIEKKTGTNTKLS